MRFLKENARRVVIKIGTNALTGEGGHLLHERITGLAARLAGIRRDGFEVLLISSGAVGMGIGRLGLGIRPSDLASLQACAAVGQSRLMEAWQSALEEHELTAAQILLTREDVRGRRRHLAIRNTLEKLLSYGAIPIVNENDTVSADEIRFGDNDVLSALVASLVKADLLIILSTIPGLMEDQGKGSLIPVVHEIDERIRSMAGGALNARSTGGMITKLEAAALATQSGCGTFIGSVADPTILGEILEGTATGTFFVPKSISLAARKRWIAFFEKPLGDLHLDPGAVEAVVNKHRSLLAKGVTASDGSYCEGAVVNLRRPGGAIVARGIVSFDANTVARVLGKDSREISQILPQRSRFELVHRDSLVLLRER